LMSYRVARVLVLGQTHGRPARIAPEYARMAVRAMASAPGFPATMKATESRAYRAGRPIDAPVTVAFGTRDRLLLRASRHLDQLPPHARVTALEKAGHVPMADNPEGVVALITATALTGTGASRRSG
jgi:pimeloyl-ACP methyl ester carboxylesterase